LLNMGDGSRIPARDGPLNAWIGELVIKDDQA
jgi:hypothetical protein